MAIHGIYENVRVFGESRAADGVSGDFHAVFDRGGGRILAVVGDVCGKGRAAAAVVAWLSPHLERLVAEGHGPAALLERLNDRIVTNGEEERFVTVTCLELDVRRGTMRAANAGHPPAFLKTPAGGTQMVGESSGPPLGLFAGQRYDEEERRAPDGASIVLVTDGVSDAFAHEADHLGFGTLAQILGRVDGAPERVGSFVVDAATSFCAHPDDATALVLRLEAATPAAAAPPALEPFPIAPTLSSAAA